MKKYTYPTRVHLNEIPDEGRDFHFDNESGELNQMLGDLIGTNTFRADLRIQPMGNVFSISGDIQTRLETECSRCGRDMEYPVQDNFSELIVVEKPRPRNSESSHVLPDDSSVFCNHISDPAFNLGEFVHEHIAASEPYVVQCQRTDCEDFVKAAQERQGPPPLMTPESPFAALKNFKPKH